MIPVRIQPQRGEPRGRKLWAIGHYPREPRGREHQGGEPIAREHQGAWPCGRVVLWAMWAIENKLPTLPTSMRAWAFVGNVGNVGIAHKVGEVSTVMLYSYIDCYVITLLYFSN